MITKSYKNFLASLLAHSLTATNAFGMMPVKNTAGNTVYTYTHVSSSTTTSVFPSNGSYTVRFTNNEAGIVLGNGTTAATENDYWLEHQITSGLRTTQSQKVWVDNDVPKAEYTITVTNMDTVAVTISEIGFVQLLRTTTAYGGTSVSNSAVLFDRTVLSTPVTIPADGVAIIRYTLQTEVL